MLELLWLLAMTVLAGLRPHQDLVLENLALRQQLAAFGGDHAFARTIDHGLRDQKELASAAISAAS